MNLDTKQLRILRHMLGIDDPWSREAVPTRNYYCANRGDPELRELERQGAVERYRQDTYDWFRTTEAGRAAGVRSQRHIRHGRSKRLYRKFLDCRDALPDLSFRTFLTDARFTEIRAGA